MCIESRIERALALLRAKGLEVGNEVEGADGAPLIPLDNVLHTFEEVYALARVRHDAE